MFGNSLDLIKEKIRAMAVDPGSGYGVLQKLALDGEFDFPISSADVVHRIKEKLGIRWKTSHVQTYMTKFMNAGLVHAVKPKDSVLNYWVLTHMPREEAMRQLARDKKIRQIEQDLFSEKLLTNLQKDFSCELSELKDNFGRNGLTSAFLLRKILEKLIIIVFGKRAVINY